ncbi:hypothetical protein ABZX83_26460 [Streptomyces thermoviolaceus]|uniref:hypothetical protein n=1 Tax=Streptomyces thermoviolaceus TaxID=1952 RepID=UPI0033BB8E29
MATQFRCCGFDGVSRIPQSCTTGLQVLRLRLLHQIDHLIELVALEVRTATQSLAVGSSFHEGTNRVDDKPAERP